MESKVIRAPETLSAHERRTAMQVSTGDHSPGASGMPLDSSKPVTDEDELKKSMQAFFKKPSPIGEAVATAFILENIELFREFLSKHPKIYEVSAHRWIVASIDSIEKSKRHLEAANEFQIEVERGDENDFVNWGSDLKLQENQAKEDFFNRSSSRRSRSNQ